MKTVSVTKEITWDMAHRLDDYRGKCYNIHGHTYKLQVTFTGIIKQDGMIIDFNALNKYLLEVKEYYDHAIVLDNSCENDKFVGKAITSIGCVCRFLSHAPTAENMAVDIFDYIAKNIPANASYAISKVRLYETATSYAEVTL